MTILNGPCVPRRCLVHVVRSANVRYSKVRPLHPLCQFDVCRHEVRYGCQREDSCSFAHSVIELKCWVLQQDTGALLLPLSSPRAADANRISRRS